MNGRIDLHVHTTASDGTAKPEEVVALAGELGLSAVAITDHDTVSGYKAAAAAATETGPEVVPGIEISTKFRRSVHILGYYIDVDSPKLRPVLDWVVQDRTERNIKMAALMAADGIPITYEQMQQQFGEVIGRPHFAEVLMKLGYAESIQDAFDRYVERGQKYYVPRSFLSIERSVEIIREAGGIPVLAHPFQYRLDDEGLRELIEHCMDHGLMGMECRYTGYDREKTGYLEALAREYGLLPTGGSDFHGEHKKHIHLGTGAEGELDVPYAFLEGLKSIRN